MTLRSEHWPEYQSWFDMKRRCQNPKAQQFKNYGARGIRVCERWLADFANFLADMGRRPSPRHTLDRVNNDGPYAPDNCRWATRAEQRANQRTCHFIEVDGRRVLLRHAAEAVGMAEQTLYSRIYYWGWSVERALKTPVDARKAAWSADANRSRWAALRESAEGRP